MKTTTILLAGLFMGLGGACLPDFDEFVDAHADDDADDDVSQDDDDTADDDTGDDDTVDDDSTTDDDAADDDVTGDDDDQTSDDDSTGDDDSTADDDDDTTLPEDLDGDGYSSDVDCDDTDPMVFPGAQEFCDGKDTDCDGVIPVGEEDLDGDGWPVCLGDCDDGEPLANPGLSEVCNDWVDNDCDGTDNGCTLSGTVPLAQADAQLTAEAANDGVGGRVEIVPDTDGDGLDDILIGAMFVGNSYQGAGYLVRGAPTGTLSLLSADAKIEGAGPSQMLGRAIAGGDLDGDGLGDILVSTSSERGYNYLFNGPVAGIWSANSADTTITGYLGGFSDHAGWPVVVGDTDGDGVDDLLVGATGLDGAWPTAGGGYLLLGPVGLGQIDLSTDAEATLTGTTSNGMTGGSVAGGDVNGDGLGDLILGAFGGGGYNGSVYLVHGPVTGDVDLANADTTFIGAFGDAVDSGGDLDGDGNDEIVIGARTVGGAGANAGRAYVVYGPAPAGIYDLSLADARLSGGAAGDEVGYDVAMAGDVNGDGLGDLLVAAPGAGATGAVYLFYGPVYGDLDPALAADVVFEGDGTVDGTSVDGGGDLNADGYGDLVIGSTWAGAGGVVYVIYGAGM